MTLKDILVSHNNETYNKDITLRTLMCRSEHDKVFVPAEGQDRQIHLTGTWNGDPR